MKRTILATIFLAMANFIPCTAVAGVDINIGISIPPPFVFAAPPEVVVLPDTPFVYVAPDVEFELFFWDGWWWRPWEGRWYRSRYYDRGWVFYRSVPTFYYDVDPGWRRYYHDHSWFGHRWNYERVPYRSLERNWKTWNRDRYWERKRNWNVQGYRPVAPRQRMELRNQRQMQYRQRPDVRLHEQQMQQRQIRERQVRPPAPQPQVQPSRPQFQERRLHTVPPQQQRQFHGDQPRLQRTPQPQPQPRMQRVPQPQPQPRMQRVPQQQPQPRMQQAPRQQVQPPGRQNGGEGRHERPQGGPGGGGQEHLR